ncbi:IMP cyclohydrolase / Phosphoribosylaminoimidazolecarboxamide formyltransferase [invertebrate metagenome]|uniref:IMP cyclohydrolase / Phosphoribosylaminoimidazolecarboxamide formyltransferase n=1 Tax=invertebrate metagenome TaxID=1711999 RepID=A0A484H7D2_9ZZZZ
MSDFTLIRRALISVSDKTGIIAFARFLVERGIEILSTGGSATVLRGAGLAVTEVAEYTAFPEIFGGRVKTLHPRIHGGLLGKRDDDDHAVAMVTHGIEPIDLLVVNLYPFKQAVAHGADFATCVETIDIGGAALIRAAAKNHVWVTVLVDPADYPTAMEAIDRYDGATSASLRRRLATVAYARIAAYDATIAAWFAHQIGEIFPQQLNIAATLQQTLRYGENPHQQAAFYVGDSAAPSLATTTQVQGKELSYNNLCDTDAALELAAAFYLPVAVIVKHSNPCGCAIGENLEEAYLQALSCDPFSAFGGIVAVNRPLDAAVAAAIMKTFVEVVVAPDATTEARALFAKKKNLRLLLTGTMPDPRGAGMLLRSVAGGFLLQTRDTGRIQRADLKVVSQRPPSEQEWEDLLFGWVVCKHVKSNAVVFVRDRTMIGVGAGQTSRVDSVRVAVWKAAEVARATGQGELAAIRGSVVASDAFFPFPDGLIAAYQAGATAVIQPGGSVRDAEVIKASDDRDMAMVFTGIRHFRH